MAGPLSGIRIVELAGIGPGPFAAMMLADNGAEVIRVERPGGVAPVDATMRSRRSVVLDLKTPEGSAALRALCKTADGLIEGYRPGVMERLGLGPETLLADNPRLAYGRMTGWGQDGPYAQAAGHDLNYIAITGALHNIGRRGEPPAVPLNLVGDYGGGGMYLAFGLLATIWNVQKTGKGQVIDCAIVDGAASLMTVFYSMFAQGTWKDMRGSNQGDGGSHFYDVYQTADGGYISIASVEPQFYATMRQLTGLDSDTDFNRQMDPAAWPALKDKVRALFRTKTRDQWCALLEATDACFAPVLSMAEAPKHRHNVARGTFIEIDGQVQPAPAPRYSRTPNATPRAYGPVGADTQTVLAELGLATSTSQS
ncbi:CaiB/BaiF CoA transferase family protein [Burkholderia sp. MSMB1826]|uniref:CaiB/BaiF CoA transferase family protein n=1 Tax=Burkholderia sp. MSMB1826 TaxID=1637875 RepID=UPI00075F2C1B|nr:CaiB/BaiF CoA-transferase family protein [Burkholderia sp. MSMB1826]KVL19474.1 carnitine dehydratase [Burkholderia sp. MSMB1826]